MLSAPHRLVDTADHKLVARRGRKGRSGPVNVSVLGPVAVPAAAPRPVAACRAAVVVPKRVGTSVQRNRVQRQLRHLLRDRLTMLPTSGLAVVRAEPGAFGLTSQHLAEHLDRALFKAQSGSRTSSGPAAIARRSS